MAALGLEMEDIKQILKVHFKDRINFGPVDAKSISEAEEMLNITFPPSYRTYLTEYGASYGSGIEMYGLPDAREPPEWVNAAQQTLNVRKSTNISYGYLAISDDGGDFRYYLDCASPNNQGECPVVKVGPGIETFEIVANSFAEFASQLCLL
jgi:antitoxin YobK